MGTAYSGDVAGFEVLGGSGSFGGEYWLMVTHSKRLMGAVSRTIAWGEGLAFIWILSIIPTGNPGGNRVLLEEVVTTSPGLTSGVFSKNRITT